MFALEFIIYVPDPLPALVNSLSDQGEATPVGTGGAGLEHLPVDHLEQRHFAPDSPDHPLWPVSLPQEHRERSLSCPSKRGPAWLQEAEVNPSNGQNFLQRLS